MSDHSNVRRAPLRGITDLSALAIVLLAFAVAIMACGVASAVAWQRCGGGADCSTELAVSVIGLAPGALLFCVILLLIAFELPAGARSRVIISLAVGVAFLPLIAFTMADAVRSLIVAGLVSGLTLSLLSRGARETRERAPLVEEEVMVFERTRAMRVTRQGISPATTPTALRAAVRPAPRAQVSDLLEAPTPLERARLLESRVDALIERFGLDDDRGPPSRLTGSG